jgi:exodeoxyribonuclease V alpha subunit
MSALPYQRPSAPAQVGLLPGFGASPKVKPARRGVVQRVVFENAETGFRIAKVLVDGKVESWKGTMPSLSEGMEVIGTGDASNDPKWGAQFQVDTCSTVLPTTGAGLVSFLASGPFPGIGPKTAQLIVDTFGDRAKEVLKAAVADPTELAKVRGISRDAARKIGEAWAEQEAVAPILMWLQERGIPGFIAGRIYAKYKGASIEVVERTPYRLTEVSGIGFKIADMVAAALGVPRDSPARIEAGVLHVLGESTNKEGHCWSDRDDLVNAADKLLAIGNRNACNSAVARLAAYSNRPPIKLDGARVYSARIYEAEFNVASMMANLLRVPGPDVGMLAEEDEPLPPLTEAVRESIEDFERRTGATLAPEQRQAVEAVAFQKVLVVTGGPGVGKTTVLRACLSVLDARRMRVLLASPTGRAAKRMNEATGRPATTIHRLLGWNGKEFAYNEDSPLRCDAVAIDEASMGDLPLMESLLKAIPPTARVIIIGDVDQLPSVGPGAVLHDFIESGVIPTVRLTRIFRQGEGSSIVTNAALINSGQRPVGDTSEFLMYPASAAASDTAAHILDLVARELPQRFGFNSVRDIQVLTPMHNGDCGTKALNAMLQAALNPHGDEMKRGDRVFRVGDKVMQTKNDAAREVYNGDLGYITSVNAEAKTLTVDIDGVRVPYEGKHLEHLAHAYACSVHKMQGGQAPCVLVVMLSEHYMLLGRNLLYTAVTRAQKVVALVSDGRAVGMALRNTTRDARRTSLAQRIALAMNPPGPATILAALADAPAQPDPSLMPPARAARPQP